MASIAQQTIVGTGLAPTYQAASAVSDTFVNDGSERQFLHVKNADGAVTREVTIAVEVASTTKPGFGTLTKAAIVVEIAAADDEFIGPVELTAYGANPVITYDDESDVTVALLKI